MKYYNEYMEPYGISTDAYMELIDNLEIEADKYADIFSKEFKSLEDFIKRWNLLSDDYLRANGVFEEWFRDAYTFKIVRFDEFGTIMGTDI